MRLDQLAKTGEAEAVVTRLQHEVGGRDSTATSTHSVAAEFEAARTSRQIAPAHLRPTITIGPTFTNPTL